MINIIPPMSFDKLCRNLYQGLNPGSAEQLVQFALVDLNAEDVKAVKTFLESELLAGKYTPEELRQWWWTTPSTIVFSEGDGLLAFLRMLSQAFDKPPYSP